MRSSIFDLRVWWVRAGAVVLVAAMPAIAQQAEAEKDTKVDEQPKAIAFHKTLIAAQREAKEKRQVTAAYFTASWCRWCGKMASATLGDPRVIKLGERFTWAKIDIDRRPELAATFGVQGVPALVLINMEGEAIGGEAGFLTVEQTLTLLNKHVDQAEAPGAQAQMREAVEQMHQLAAKATTPAEAHAAVMPVVELLARPDRPARAWLSDEAAKLTPIGWPGLIEAMTDPRLAVRAAAGSALAAATQADLPFDPFADADTRKGQVDAWRTWLKERPDKSEEPEPAPPTEP